MKRSTPRSGNSSRTGIVDSISRRGIFVQTDRVGESIYEAYAAAEEWISQKAGETTGRRTE
jgi:hypothetical protein